MTGAATIAVVMGILASTTALGLLLAVWLPMLAAGGLSVALAADEARRWLRRWRATKRWARRAGSARTC